MRWKKTRAALLEKKAAPKCCYMWQPPLCNHTMKSKPISAGLYHPTIEVIYTSMGGENNSQRKKGNLMVPTKESEASLKCQRRSAIYPPCQFLIKQIEASRIIAIQAVFFDERISGCFFLALLFHKPV